MELSQFIEAIHGGAAIKLQPSTMWNSPSDADRERSESLLRDADRVAALHAPGAAVELSLEASIWSATVLRWLTAMMLDRVQSEIGLPETFQSSQPSIKDPMSHWSVDLMFRFLPDLRRRSSSGTHEDPLTGTIDEVAKAWPLSSGVRLADDKLNSTAWETIRADGTLRRISEERWSGSDKRPSVCEEEKLLKHWM